MWDTNQTHDLRHILSLAGGMFRWGSTLIFAFGRGGRVRLESWKGSIEKPRKGVVNNSLRVLVTEINLNYGKARERE